jgi:glycosyltransferase involved in cell wall biosynthesis
MLHSSNQIDVIIPSKTTEKHVPFLLQTINSLKASETNYNFNVVVVESGSFPVDCGQDDTLAFDQKRFSYNRALNLGIAATNADWIVMANNDLIFHPGWFSEIIRQHFFWPQVRSFSPWNNFGNWHPAKFPQNESELFLGYRICFEIAGWCIVVKRDLMNSIDLDERCSLWYSDNIYADELIKYGHHHGLVANSLVDHIVSQTIDYHTYLTNDDRDLYLQGKR